MRRSTSMRAAPGTSMRVAPRKLAGRVPKERRHPVRRFLLPLLVVGLLATGLTAGSAVAAPSEVSATYGPKAQFVSPVTLLLPATVTCPATFVTSPVEVVVSQSDTGGVGEGFGDVPCTGDPETVVLVVTGGPFTLGQAIVRGFAFAGAQLDEDTRRIQIVL
jgi:hypothetical protein